MGHGVGYAPLFFCLNIYKLLTIYPKGYIIKDIERRTKQISAEHWKGEKAMGKKQKKKPIKWRDLAITALIDLIIGTVLILIDKLLK